MTTAPAFTTEELRLDLLARALLGTEGRGGVEALLGANPGLAALGPFVPAATAVVVPAFDAAAPVLATVNPWE